ncbi:MAG: hypothetical protein AABY42_07540 [Nitrospirota bacterium]
MKRLLTIGLVVGIVALSITAVYAFGPHYGAGPFAGDNCMGYTNLTPEQKTKAEQFQKDTLPVRQQLLAKHSELMTLKHQAKPDWKAIGEKQKEIVDLRTEIAKKADELGVTSFCSGPGTMGTGSGTPCGGPGRMGMMRGRMM